MNERDIHGGLLPPHGPTCSCGWELPSCFFFGGDAPEEDPCFYVECPICSEVFYYEAFQADRFVPRRLRKKDSNVKLFELRSDIDLPKGIKA